MAYWYELLIALCLLGGGLFALIGAFGLVKLPDLFTRLHAATKASTLGIGGVMVGALLYFSATGDGISLRELLLMLFLFITAPVSAHLVAKSALSTSVLSTTAHDSAKNSKTDNTTAST